MLCKLGFKFNWRPQVSVLRMYVLWYILRRGRMTLGTASETSNSIQAIISTTSFYNNAQKLILYDVMANNMQLQSSRQWPYGTVHPRQEGIAGDHGENSWIICENFRIMCSFKVSKMFYWVSHHDVLFQLIWISILNVIAVWWIISDSYVFNRLAWFWWYELHR